MKTFIIFALFLGAAFLPILFVPLLALTLLVLLIFAPELLTNHVWGKTWQDMEEEAHHGHR